jgi:erythromycin esterase-like protein
MRSIMVVVLAVMVPGSVAAAPRLIEVVAAGAPVRGALAHLVQGPDASTVVPVDGTVRVEGRDRWMTIATRDGFASVDAASAVRVELDRSCLPVAIETIDAAKRGTPVQVRLRALTLDHVFVAMTDARGRGQVCLPPDEYATEIDAADATSFLQVARPGSGRPVRLVAVARARASARSIDREVLRRATRRLDTAGLLAALPRRARLVALGEPTHGTTEPVVLRGEIARAAMATGPVLIIAQMPAGDAVAIERYLRGTDAALVAPAASLSSWKWSTVEVAEQLGLLREANLRRGGGRIRLVGVDPLHAASTYRELARAAAGDAALSAQVARLAVLGDEVRARDAAANGRESRVLLTALRGLTAVPGASAEVGALAGALIEYVELRSAPTGTRTARRDEIMATRAAAQVRAHRGPAFLWARNLQIAREPYGDAISMGQHLARQLGAGYVVVGALTGGGETLAFGLDVRDGVGPQRLPAADADLVEHALGDLHGADVLVDLGTDRVARRALRATPRWVREVGLAWTSDRDTRFLRNLGVAFDLIAFTRVSRALTLTPAARAAVGPGSAR